MLQGQPKGRQVLAVYIEGKEGDASSKGEGKDAKAQAADSKDGKDQAEGNEPSSKKTPGVRAVYVADADCASQVFFDIRNRPDSFEEIDFRLQNVTFVLNAIDVLANETDYPKIRRHVPDYRTLRLVESEAEKYRREAAEKRDEFSRAFTEQETEAENESQKAEAELRAKIDKLKKEGAIDPSKQAELIALMQQFALKERQEERKLDIKLEQMRRDRDKNIADAQRKADRSIMSIQNRYKFWAVILPTIPPLLVGMVVFVSRRLREREGIAKSRLK